MSLIKPTTAAAVLATVLVGLSILYFTYLKTRDFLGGVGLTLLSPSNGQTAPAGTLIELEGEGRQIARLSINGQSVLADQNGHFNQPLIVSRGYNIFEVRASDRFGREVVEYIEVVGS